MSEEERRQAERGEGANSGNSQKAIFESERVLPRSKAVEELGERRDKGGGGEGGDGLTTGRQPGWSSNSREQVRGLQKTPSRAKVKQGGAEEALEATGAWETLGNIFFALPDVCTKKFLKRSEFLPKIEYEISIRIYESRKAHTMHKSSFFLSRKRKGGPKYCPDHLYDKT